MPWSPIGRTAADSACETLLPPRFPALPRGGLLLDLGGDPLLQLRELELLLQELEGALQLLRRPLRLGRARLWSPNFGRTRPKVGRSRHTKSMELGRAQPRICQTRTWFNAARNWSIPSQSLPTLTWRWPKQNPDLGDPSLMWTNQDSVEDSSQLQQSRDLGPCASSSSGVVSAQPSRDPTAPELHLCVR